MKAIRVIAPLGATIRGPVTLGLTEDQAKRRTAILTKGKRKGQYELAGGASAMFKHGEELGIDGLERLNAQLFEDLDAAAEADALAAKEAEDEAKAKAASANGAGQQLPLGSDTIAGGASQ